MYANVKYGHLLVFGVGFATYKIVTHLVQGYEDRLSAVESAVKELRSNGKPQS
jgi:hypothetical protein